MLEAAACCDSRDVAAISRLRKKWSLEEVSAALELAEARRRAIGKFEQPENLIADRVGLEQATGSLIANYKAERIKDSGFDQISDLCCGIGGDAMAMAARMDVIGFDMDPLKCWMTGVNAGCCTQCGDITSMEIPPGPIHIDPSRRDSDLSQRRHNPDSWSPSADALTSLVRSHPDAVIKMGPGIDQDKLTFRSHESEVEFISNEGSLSQAILWTGGLSTAMRRATRCGPDGHLTISSDVPEHPPLASTDWADTWLHVPDPALERAELLGMICREWNMFEPASGLGLLVADQPARTPWLIPYHVVDKLPWRMDKIKSWLKAHDSGAVEIRTRGRAIEDVDKVRAGLQGHGSQAWTIFGLRLGDARIAVITHPRGR
ncbi:MAG: hypothetical protein P8M22_03155 [Phycisphaerales bacterium]|nr:hypothetical protein [Phycisphaerales bacterium]